MSSLQEILEERRQAWIKAAAPLPPPRQLSKWEQEQEAKWKRKKRPSASGSKMSANQKREMFVKYARSDEGWKDAAKPDCKMPWHGKGPSA